MKIKKLIGVALAAGLIAGCATEKHESHNKEAKQAKLMAQAKVSKEDAEKTALAQVPNGMVKEAELEKEHGKIIWSFDIATPGSQDIKEVAIDAIDGKVVAVETETPADQAKEAAEDAKKDKKEKD